MYDSDRISIPDERIAMKNKTIIALIWTLFVIWVIFFSFVMSLP